MKPVGGHLYIKNRFGLHIDLIIVSSMEIFLYVSFIQSHIISNACNHN